jgi:hypothetical protein
MEGAAARQRMVINPLRMTTVPAKMTSQASMDVNRDGENNKLEVVLVAMTYPIAQTGIPNTSLKMMLTILPPRTPSQPEYMAVKALAALKANPANNGIRKVNTNFYSPLFAFLQISRAA